MLTTHDTDSGLWLREPDKCCAIRKVAPLSRALSGFDAWISGRKRYQGGMRAELPLVEADGDRIKINPLADWTKDDSPPIASATICPSIRSSPTAFARSAACPAPRASPKARTSATAAGAAPDKTECGIHLGLAVLRDGRQRHMNAELRSDLARTARFHPDEWIRYTPDAGAPRRRLSAARSARRLPRRAGPLPRA